MHNGVVEEFKTIARELVDLLDTDCYTNMQGSTDSEHLAARKALTPINLQLRPTADSEALQFT